MHKADDNSKMIYFHLMKDPSSCQSAQEKLLGWIQEEFSLTFDSMPTADAPLMMTVPLTDASVRFVSAWIHSDDPDSRVFQPFEIDVMSIVYAFLTQGGSKVAFGFPFGAVVCETKTSL